MCAVIRGGMFSETILLTFTSNILKGGGMMKIINKRFGKFREKYLPSIDLGNYEIYNPETVYNLI